VPGLDPGAFCAAIRVGTTAHRYGIQTVKFVKIPMEIAYSPTGG
jgi:hypothetical protein